MWKTNGRAAHARPILEHNLHLYFKVQKEGIKLEYVNGKHVAGQMPKRNCSHSELVVGIMIIFSSLRMKRIFL